MRTLALSIFMTLAATHSASAAVRPATPQPPSPAVPALSLDTRWALGLIGGAGVLLAAAAILGPLLRMGLPDEIPQTHSHDEPPGSSDHHGPGGTIDLVLPDRHD